MVESFHDRKEGRWMTKLSSRRLGGMAHPGGAMI
jgi:hypothetical protein